MAYDFTKDLYKKLRAATIKRDDAEIRSILTKIVQCDPADRNAITQLKELEAKIATHTPQNVAKPKAATSKLYAKFRNACLTKNDLQAYEIICQILEITPDDQEAQKQKVELGLRVATARAGKLENALETGNEKIISQVVQEFLPLASVNDLLNIPNFSAAHAIHQSYLHKSYLNELAQLRQEMQDTEGAYEREQKAKAIEVYTADKKLVLAPDLKAELETIHQEWMQVCRESAQYATFNSLAKEYNNLQQQVALKENLDDAKIRLEEIQQTVESLNEVPEAANMLQQLKLTLKKTKAGLAAQRRNRKMVMNLLTLMTGALLLSAGVGYYAYSHVPMRTDELKTAVQQKNITAAQALLDEAYPMSKVYSLFSTEYAEWLDRTTKWVEKYNNSIARLQEFEKWLDANLNHANSDNARELMNEMNKHSLMIDELVHEYNYKMSSDLSHKASTFNRELTEKVNYEAWTRFNNPPADATIAQLAELYSKYKDFRDSVGSFGPDENRAIRTAFCTRVERLISGNKDNPEQLDALNKEIKKHAATLELPQELLDLLAVYHTQSKDFQQLPTRLGQCLTISDYINTIRKCEALVVAENKDLSVDTLSRQAAYLPELVIKLKAGQYSATLGNLNYSALLKKLADIRNAYSANGSIFVNFSPTEYTRIVDLMTQPKKAPEWSNSYHQVTTKTTVHIGSMTKNAKGISLREVTPGMKLARKATELSKNCQTQQLTHANIRQEMGFNRLSLQQGKVNPLHLMSNLSKASSKSYAQLAKAYLYSLSIDLLNLVDTSDSGVVFSPSLQENIRKFNELRQELATKGVSLTPGCWCLSHPISADEKLQKFFEKSSRNDYIKEILDNISRLQTAKSEFAGYINKEGKYTFTKSYPSEKLYYLKGGKLSPLDSSVTAPFTPVFYID